MMQKSFIAIVAFILLAGARCRTAVRQQQPSTPSETGMDQAAPSSTGEAPIQASFDTNDYLDEALAELDAVE